MTHAIDSIDVCGLGNVNAWQRRLNYCCVSHLFHNKRYLPVVRYMPCCSEALLSTVVLNSRD